MRAAKFDSRRANDSNNSISHGGETVSQRPVSADQTGLPNGFVVSPGLWPSQPHQPAPRAPIEAPTWYKPAPNEHSRREAATTYPPTTHVESRRPEAGRPPPVPNYRSTAPLEQLPRTGPQQQPAPRGSLTQPEATRPYRS